MNPQQRIKHIRHGNGLRPGDVDMFAPVELLKVLPGGFDDELHFHAALYDVNVIGEWFEATPEVLAWVDQVGEDPFDETNEAPAHLERLDLAFEAMNSA